MSPIPHLRQITGTVIGLLDETVQTVSQAQHRSSRDPGSAGTEPSGMHTT
jgi:hypothetical protein